MFYGYVYHMSGISLQDACSKIVERYFIDDIPDSLLPCLNCQELIENELDILVLNEGNEYYFICDGRLEDYNL